jgi:hypothetical protein
MNHTSGFHHQHKTQHFFSLEISKKKKKFKKSHALWPEKVLAGLRK